MLNLKDAELQGGQPCGAGEETVAEHNLLWVRARSTCCVCKVRGLGPVDHGGGQTAEVFSAWESHQDGIWHLHGLQKHLSHNTLWTWKIAWSPWGSRGKAALPVNPPLSPHLNETSETGLFFLGPFSLPCSPLFPCLWGFLLNYLVLSNFITNLMLQKIKKKETCRWWMACRQNGHFLFSIILV